METMAVELDDTDRTILGELTKGRCTPSYLSKRMPVTRQTIQNRLAILVAADLVEKVDTGLYEITDEGAERLQETNPTDEAHDSKQSSNDD